MAGLIYRYDESAQYYLRATWDEDRRTRTLGLLVFDRKEMTLPLGRDEVDIGSGELRLQLTVRFAAARFWWSRGERPWQAIGPELDAGKISDDYGGLGFTGAFVGMACQDLQRQEFPADFASFTYEVGSLEIYHGMSRFTCDGEFSIAGLVGGRRRPILSSLDSPRTPSNWLLRSERKSINT